MKDTNANPADLSDGERLDIFQALAEKLNQSGWIPAPPWWMEVHPGAYAFWHMLAPEDKINTWISAPNDDYIALVEFLLSRYKEKP